MFLTISNLIFAYLLRHAGSNVDGPDRQSTQGAIFWGTTNNRLHNQLINVDMAFTARTHHCPLQVFAISTVQKLGEIRSYNILDK